MRVFTFGPTQTIHNCNNWLRSGLIWSQACTNGDGQISLDDAGNIQSITMALGAELGVVTLRVAK
jgi:hypothetical protein